MSRAEVPPAVPEVRVRLYVAKDAPNSVIAQEELEAYLAANPHIPSTVEIVDVLDDAERALRDGVLVTPTLVVLRDGAERRVIGNLRNSHALATALPGRKSTP